MAGAKVTLAGRQDTTNANGVAKIVVEKGTRVGKRTIKATKAGYYRVPKVLRIMSGAGAGRRRIG